MSGEYRINIDASESEPLRRIWRYLGYDEPNYTYTNDGRALLGKIGALADAPYFVRTHFLLCSGDGIGKPKWGSTNVYTETADQNGIYDWQLWDRIFDTHIQNGCIPFVEIGFMPEALSSAPSGVRYDDPFEGGWRYPPKNYERWAALVRAVATHSWERYGSRSTAEWYWELWNEPDIFYWKGTLDDYCGLFDYTESALHEIMPYARLGGPAVTGPRDRSAAEFLEGFLSHCVDGRNHVSGGHGTRLDFVTFHTKGALMRPDNAAAKQTPTTSTLIDHITAGLSLIEKHVELKNVEVILSECDPDGWAAGTVYDNPNLEYRNTEYYAAYVAATVCELIDVRHGDARVDGMLTWAFQFEDRGYFEGLRTLSTNNIDKPVLNVFRMLARLGPRRLRCVIDYLADGPAPAVKDNAGPPATTTQLSAIATYADGPVYALLVVAHNDDWDKRETIRVDVELRGVSGSMLMTRSVIDASHSNSYSRWLEIGRPQEPTFAQLRELESACRIEPTDVRQIEARNNTCAFDISMTTHSVHLITLEAR